MHSVRERALLVVQKMSRGMLAWNLAHSIKSLTDRANLKKRLGLRFTKIRKLPVIGERKCRLCLADVRGGKMNA